MTVLAFKWTMVGVIFVAGVIGGALPRFFARARHGMRWMSLSNAFACGIFLGVGLLHLLPESQEALSKQFSEHAVLGGFPLAGLVSGLGFLLVLFVERVLMGTHYYCEKPDGRTLYPMLLMTVLSLHSIIAGMTVGVEENVQAGAMVCIAILAHKSTAAFALGTSFQHTGASGAKFWPFITVFAMMTPLGVILGIFASGLLGAETGLGQGCFDALAAGTFLYIAIADILPESFTTAKGRWGNFLAVLVGFAAMAAIATVI